MAMNVDAEGTSFCFKTNLLGIDAICRRHFAFCNLNTHVIGELA